MSKEKKLASSLSLEELAAKGAELDAQLFKLRMQKATGQLGNTATIRYVRKDLARVKTFQTQKRTKTAQQQAKGK